MEIVNTRSISSKCPKCSLFLRTMFFLNPYANSNTSLLFQNTTPKRDTPEGLLVHYEYVQNKKHHVTSQKYTKRVINSNTPVTYALTIECELCHWCRK